MKNKIEELKKGCGKKLPVKSRKFRDSIWCDRNQLCSKCKARIEIVKEMQEDFLKVIDKVFTSDRRRSYCKEYCQKYLIEDLEELKKEVGKNERKRL